MMNNNTVRNWAIKWLYAVCATHLIVGLLLPWVADATLFDAYHRSIEAFFWGQTAPVAARAQQVWWISLFGPTVQDLALFMAALTHLGDRHRSSTAWASMMAGLVIWAPQDMLISLRAACWPHVWIDLAALASLLPPLLWLWRADGTSNHQPAKSQSAKRPAKQLAKSLKETTV